MKLGNFFLWAMGLLLLAALGGCSKKPKLKVAVVAKDHVESVVTTVNSGTVDAENSAAMGFGAVGRVKKIYIGLGEEVKSGQILAEIDNNELEVIYREGLKELERAQALWREGLISKVAWDEAKKMVEVAKANLDRTQIRAPFNGMVAELNIQVGDLISSAATAQKIPLRLIDNKPRRVKGVIDEFDLAKVKVGQKARVRIAALQAQPLKAVVSKVVPFISASREQDRTVHIELELKEGDAKVPVGASADVEIITDEKEQVLSLPTRCILGTKSRRYVYRLVGDRLKKTPVEVGLGSFDRTEITQGVAEGERVVFPSESVDLEDGMKVIEEKAE